MAEICGRGHLSYLLAIQNVTILSKKELVTADSKGCFVVPELLTAELKRTVLFGSNRSFINHPARASSDVASSLAPSPGRRPAPVGAWSARRDELRLQSARCSIRPVVPGKVLRPRRKRRRCPSPTAPAARSHPGGRVRAAAIAEMIEYRCASVAVPPMA